MLPDTPLAYITQTTLSVDETREIVAVLKRRFPRIEGPEKEDICYATSNRQWAVKELLGEVELLLVIGSPNSSNSNRLVEVAHAAGVAAHLIDDETRDRRSVDRRRRERRRHLRRLRPGAARRAASATGSAPAAPATSREFRSAFEDVVFKLPVELRRASRSAA